MTIGLALKLKQPDAKGFLQVLMDVLEEEKTMLPPEEPSSALGALARDLFARARAADQTATIPNASDRWSVVEAPRVAGALHAAAVLVDAMRMYGALPQEMAELQRHAHGRSQLLARQLAKVFNATPCVPIDWSPASTALLPAVTATSTLASSPPTPPPSSSAMPSSLPAPPAPLPVASLEDSGLPAGWEARVDPASGRTFYVNLILKSTSWERPISTSTAEVGRPEATSDAVAGGIAAVTPSAAVAPLTPLVDAPPLPEGWEERMDPSSGRRFYVDVRNRTTSWERPSVTPTSSSSATDSIAGAAAGSGSGDRVAPGTVDALIFADAPSASLPPEDDPPMGEPVEAVGAAEHSAQPAGLSVGDEVAFGRPLDYGELTLEAATVAAEAASGVTVQTTMDEMNAMWDRMALRGDARATPTLSHASQMPGIIPPPPGASRDEVKAYRAAVRRMAVDNLRREQQEIATITGQHAKAVSSKLNSE